MKQESTPSNKPSTSQAGSAPDRQQSLQAGQSSQEQRKGSDNNLGLHSIDPKQQGNGAAGNGRQQQADTSGSKNGQTSPSRDQGHSPSGSPKSGGGNGRSDNSARQTGKNN